MKKLALLIIIMFTLFSCKCIQQEPICKEPIYVTGRLLLAKAESRTLRTVLYETNNGTMVIYHVPMNLDLVTIPICINYRRVEYFNKK